MLKSFTDKIRRSFSDAADQYDILTSLHKEIGRELVKKNVTMSATNILDVGCGTGYVANKAKFFFPESTIVGLDIAQGMIQKAKELHEGIPLEWLQADAQALPFKDNSFELILSNLAYQWVPDLQTSFQEIRRTLKPNGIFNITLFGSRTCEELFDALRNGNPKFRIRPIPSVDEIKLAVEQAGLNDVDVSYELIKVEFKSITELLSWLKAIGSNNLGYDYVFLTRQKLLQANEYYLKNYPYNEGISASFEVIWVYAKK